MSTDTDSATSLQTNDILAAYPEASLLSSGGQKVVYAVAHPTYGPTVLKLGASSSARVLERISREVDTLVDLDSPWYPKLYEFTVLNGRRFLILEERIDGGTLAENGDRFYTPLAATQLMLDIATALNELWKRKIVHRDIKPHNIMITRDGQPRIIDLGIARLLSLDSLTVTAAPWGPCTPSYASPEQLENRKDEINHRSDQFNLGILFAELLLKGRHPFDPLVVGSGDSIPENILNGRLFQEGFEKEHLQFALPLIRRMLGSQPFERFRRPIDLMNALKEAKH